jgi:hypothetical protein
MNFVNFFETARANLRYVLSLPERTLRSLAAVAGGTSLLLTDMLFPDALRGTTMYRVFVGDTQRFVIDKVAQVQREGRADGTPVSDDYVRRKMVGNALEAAGLLAMHFSPLWVFAIAGDAAAGSRVFLHRLVGHLKQNGVIPPEADPTDLVDLLEAIQVASRRSAVAINTPPLSRAELAALARELTASYGAMFTTSRRLLPEFEALWTRMERLARRENVSLAQLGGIMTVDVASWGRKGVGAVLAVGTTGSALFGEKILASYAETLDQVAEQGVGHYLSYNLRPFLKAAAAHFDPDRLTWTETETRLRGRGPRVV